jgi:hypothetical protein
MVEDSVPVVSGRQQIAAGDVDAFAAGCKWDEIFGRDAVFGEVFDEPSGIIEGVLGVLF